MTEGILLINKPKGRSSFSLIGPLRRLSGIKKIGHAGTLDPFAEGVMVLLIGKNYTKRADQLLLEDKEYVATLLLGKATTTYDLEGATTKTSELIPSLEEIEKALSHFNGTVLQTPPMFSAKKIGGKRLYDLARAGIEVERKEVLVRMKTTLISYNYPELKLHVDCSKGTYIRSIAHDLGLHLGCYAHLTALLRTRSGSFHLSDCTPFADIIEEKVALKDKLLYHL